MSGKIENQIARLALRLPELTPKQAKKMELVLDQAYRALKNKQPKMAQMILQSGGALETLSEVDKRLEELNTQITELEAEETRDDKNLKKLKDERTELIQTRTMRESQTAPKTAPQTAPKTASQNKPLPKPTFRIQPKTATATATATTETKTTPAETKPTTPVKFTLNIPPTKPTTPEKSKAPEPPVLPSTKSIAGPKRTVKYIKKNFKNCLDEGLVRIPPDNHCLFRAFGYSLMRTLGQTHEYALKWSDDNKIKLRTLAATQVCQDDELKELKKATLEDGPCLEDKSIKDLDSYCKLFGTSECWGDDIELTALLRCYEKDALLFQYRQDTKVMLRTSKESEIKDVPKITDDDELNPRELIYLVYDGRHYETFNPDALYEFKVQK